MQQEEEGFDFKAYFLRATKYWYIPALAIFVFGCWAFYKARYNTATYTVNARVLVKDEFSGWGDEYFLTGMELVSERNRLVNEIGIIRSYPLMRKVIDGLPEFNVFYYDIGNVRQTMLYKTAPFHVSFDTLTNPALYGQMVYLKVLNNHTAAWSYSKDEDFHSIPLAQPVVIEGNVLKIDFGKDFNAEEYRKKLFSFTINNPEALAVQYQNAVGVETESKESAILTLSSSSENAAKEIDFINMLADTYIAYGLERANITASNTLAFVDEQLKSILDSLLVSEQMLQKFRTQTNQQKLDYQTNSMLPGYAELEKERVKYQFAVNYYNYTLDYLSKTDDSKGLVVPSGLDNNVGDVFNQTQSNLIDLYTKKYLIEFDVTPDNIALQAIKKQIQSTKSILSEITKTRLKKAQNDLNEVNAQMAQLDSKLNALPTVERQYANIQRSYKLNNDLYTYLLQKRSEASIAKASNVTNAQVLDYATNYRVSNIGTSNQSIYNSKITTGLVLAIGVVVLLLYFDDKILSREELEKLSSMPVIGTIGHHQGDNLAVINQPKSVLAEAFRGLRTNLSYVTKNAPKACVLVTSSVSGEGKTFTSINLATIYALSGKKTLLLGADLRRPKIYMDFNLSNEKGITNYLIHKTDAVAELIQATHIDNLDLLSSGPIPPNPAELLNSSRMEELMHQLKQTYDVVVIDTAPFGLVTDALILTQYADANLYVVRHNYSRRSYLHEIAQQYKSGKVTHFSFVLNDLKPRGLKYGGYGYGYGYGSGYGYVEDGNQGYFQERRSTKKGLMQQVVSRFKKRQLPG